MRGEIAVAEAQQARQQLDSRMREALGGQLLLLQEWQECQVGST